MTGWRNAPIWKCWNSFVSSTPLCSLYTRSRRWVSWQVWQHLHFRTPDLSSLVAFKNLSALNVLEFNWCAIGCDWRDFGKSLALTPVKSITFENIDCCVESVESLLESVQLNYLYLTTIMVATRRAESQRLFRAFAKAFHCQRENPRIGFLIEHFDHARNHNGVITYRLF